MKMKAMVVSRFSNKGSNSPGLVAMTTHFFPVTLQASTGRSVPLDSRPSSCGLEGRRLSLSKASHSNRHRPRRRPHRRAIA